MFASRKKPVTASNLASHSGCMKMKLKSGAKQIKMLRIFFLAFKDFDSLVILLTVPIFLCAT